jgi:hypothetical protein
LKSDDSSALFSVVSYLEDKGEDEGAKIKKG